MELEETRCEPGIILETWKVHEDVNVGFYLDPLRTHSCGSIILETSNNTSKASEKQSKLLMVPPAARNC